MIIQQHPQQLKNNSISSPKFKSKIEILDKGGLSSARGWCNDFAKYGPFNAYTNYTMGSAFLKGNKVFTEQIRNCTYCSIINPKSRKLNSYHLSPEEENLSKLKEIREQMLEQAFELKRNSKELLEGFLTGANPSDWKDKRSYTLHQWIRGTFDDISTKIGMQFSDMSGRKDIGSEMSIVSDAERNTHSLYLEPSMKELENPNDIKNYFETNDLAKGDTVFYKQDEITNLFNNNR